MDANKLFTSSRYSEAIGEYDKALSSCPNYLEYEIAVLKSNISACHLKLEDWKAAVESATASLDALERLQPTKAKKSVEPGDEGQNGAVVEIEGDGEEAERELAELKLSDERKVDIKRIRVKALMRRAKGKMELDGWGNLVGAEEGETKNLCSTQSCSIRTDYKELSKMVDLPVQDQKIVRAALATLPSRISTAKDKEMGEMMGKLKEVYTLTLCIILGHANSIKAG